MNTDKIYAEAIVNEYSTKKTSKVIALKKLDHKVKSPANIFAFTFGIFFALVLGVGMCLAMQVIGPQMPLYFVLGISVGIIGIIGMSVNYLIYKKILEKRKQKYAFEIIELAKEVCEE